MSEPKVKPGYFHHRDDRNLTERQREVMKHLHNGLNMSQTAAVLGITRARVSAIVHELTDRGFVKRDGRKVIIDVERLIG